MNPVYRLRATAQSSRMDDNDEQPKPKGRWGIVGPVVLIIVATVIAVCVVLPLGEGVRSVFQRLVDAFRHGK
jgi:hypothetical protein